MNRMAGRRVSVMSSFFMLPAVMVLGRFAVVPGCMRMMLRSLSMMLGCFF